MATLTHGDNKKCPRVQSGEWKWCKGHEYESSREEYERKIKELIDEVEGLRAFKRNVDEALNSGDGVYRP